MKEGLRDLYEKSKREQWNGTTQLPWDTQVDPEGEIVPAAINPLRDYPPFQKLTGKDLARARHGQLALQLSQFLHGEQGAMIVASQLVGGVPWLEAKYYASSQTMDEARHVEVFSRYLREKMEWEWPITGSALTLAIQPQLPGHGKELCRRPISTLALVTTLLNWLRSTTPYRKA